MKTKPARETLLKAPAENSISANRAVKPLSGPENSTVKYNVCTFEKFDFQNTTRHLTLRADDV